jgi:carbamoyl-phosphate synthase large subunit
MSIGRSFCEAFGKALRSRELDDAPRLHGPVDVPLWDRYDTILARLRAGEPGAALAAESGVHPWFVDEFERTVAAERSLAGRGLADLGAGDWRRLKRAGLGDGWLAKLLSVDEADVRGARVAAGVRPVYKSVDSCAAEVEARSSYRYSTYDVEDEPVDDDRPAVVILGSGPNRIGQGLEFDYCCVHAAHTFRALGYAAVMVNCNPETVSTDYDTSDRLYFEPLTIEDVLEVIERERPVGVVIQFGGQTPLRLAGRLLAAGAPIIGTPFAAIDLAEDRERFGSLLDSIGLKAPDWAIANDVDEAAAAAARIGYPVLVRPSYVLGGRAMRICYDEEMLRAGTIARRTLVDAFVEDAIEIDVDAVSDGDDVLIGAVMEHVEEAGVHSGDSACVIPPLSLGAEMLEEIRGTSERIALELGVIGLINIQYAIAGGKLYVIEANPRASRTVPFVSKAIGAPLAKIACRLMLGERLADQRIPEASTEHVSVKEAVLPFARFAGADTVLGPEMKSTGEVMGIASDFPTAFGKAQAAAGVSLPREGTVFITVTDTDKPAATQLAARFHDMGFEVIATRGTAQAISRMGVPVKGINKIAEGSPHVVDYIHSGAVGMVINTPTGSGARTDGYEIRNAAVRHGIPCITTMTGASAAVRAIAAWRSDPPEPRSLQELYETGAGATTTEAPRAAS